MNIRLRLFRRHKILCALHVCAFLGFFLMYNAPLDSNDFNVAIDAPTARVNGTTHLNTSLVISERANPIFILHVGPPKTGSTTLQCELESLRNELTKDGYHYIGRPECSGIDIAQKDKKEFRIFANALVTSFDCHFQLSNSENYNKTRLSALQCWDEFLQQLNGYRDSNTNIIFSDEAISNRMTRSWQYRPNIPYPWDALKLALRGWDVRVLIVHRPLYDYIPSVYTDQYKVGPNKRKLKLWHGGGKCIDQGGKSIPTPFVLNPPNDVKITMATLFKADQTLFPTPAQIYELISGHDFEILLVDMNEISSNGENFINEIVCRRVPGLVSTCKALRQTQVVGKKEGPRNPSLPLHYDFVAIEACQSGLINGTLVSREEVRNAMQRRQEEELGLGSNALPLDCLGEDLMGKILKISVEHEQRLHDKDWSNEIEVLHEIGFRQAAGEGRKFCSVNVTRVLEDETWRRFFLSL